MNDFRENLSPRPAIVAAMHGIASLRFYTWSEPTLSLGYFQPSRVAGSLCDSQFGWA